MIDAFVNQDILLQFAGTARLDEARLAEVLAREEITVQEVTTSQRCAL